MESQIHLATGACSRHFTGWNRADGNLRPGGRRSNANRLATGQLSPQAVPTRDSASRMNKTTQYTLCRQGLKTIMAALGATFGLAVGASAQKQPEDLYNFYELHGDSLFETLYYVPETRETVLKHVPEHFEWVGFELNVFERFPAADKLALLADIVTQLEQMDEDQQRVTIGRIRDWRTIRSQLGLFTGFLSNEPFFSLAFEDPLLKPVFQSYLDKRPADFNPAHIGESLSSAEHETFIPALVGKLLEVPVSERFKCFSRLYADMAAIEAAKEKQAAP